MIIVVKTCISTAVKVVKNIYSTALEVVKTSGLKCNWIFCVFFYLSTKMGMIIVVKTCISTAVNNIYLTTVKVVKISRL